MTINEKDIMMRHISLDLKLIQAILHCVLFIRTVGGIDARICHPRVRCQNQCNENAEETDKHTSCKIQNHNDITMCSCKAETCYAIQNLCLYVCEEHTIENISSCASCLTKTLLDLHQLTMNITETNVTCKDVCDGMCIDNHCNITSPDTKQSQKCTKCISKPRNEHCPDDECAPKCFGGCHKSSGYCKQCAIGKYGPQCEYNCSQTCLKNECSTEWGTCISCPVGFLGETCDIPCPKSSYGNNCNHSCPAFCLQNTCTPDTGRCATGCMPGYFGSRCTKICPKGLYGDKCLSECPVTCKDSNVCHHTNGRCETGCISGFWGDHCNTTCPEGYYGTNCKDRCSQNCFRRLCDAFSGTCLTCDEAYYGPFCEYTVFNLNKQGVLGSDLSAGEATLMIVGLIIFGVLMWLCVAYLYFHQRKRLLKDAARGIDPRQHQLGIHPHARGIAKAKRVFDKKWGQFSHSESIASSKRRKHIEDEVRSLERNHRRRTSMPRLRQRADDTHEPFWWQQYSAQKPTLPNTEEIERVQQWLSHHHGITLPQTTTGAIRIAESRGKAQHDGAGGEGQSSTLTELKLTRMVTSSGRVQRAKSSTSASSLVYKGREKITPRIRSQSTTDTTNRPSEKSSTLKNLHSIEPVTQSSNQETIGNLYTRPFGQENELNGLGMRRDAILLSPKPYPGVLAVPGVQKIRRDTNRVQWLQEKDSTSDSTTHQTSRTTDSRKETTTSSGSVVSTTNESSASTTSSDEETVTATYTTTTNTKHDYSSSTEDSSLSSSSEDSTSTDDSTVSTVLSADRSGYTGTKNNYKNNKTKYGDDTTVGEAIPTPTLFQRFVGAFKKKGNPIPSQLSTQPKKPPRTLSIAGAGGRPRPYSNQFVINRLETWNRNRGIEYNPDDGMLEVFGRTSQRAADRKKNKARQDISCSHVETSDETSCSTTDRTGTRQTYTTSEDDNRPSTVATTSKSKRSCSTTGDFRSSSTLETDDS